MFSSSNVAETFENVYANLSVSHYRTVNDLLQRKVNQKYFLSEKSNQLYWLMDQLISNLVQILI